MALIEIDGLPIKSINSMVIFHGELLVYQRVTQILCEASGDLHHFSWLKPGGRRTRIVSKERSSPSFDPKKLWWTSDMSGKERERT